VLVRKLANHWPQMFTKGINLTLCNNKKQPASTKSNWQILIIAIYLGNNSHLANHRQATLITCKKSCYQYTDFISVSKQSITHGFQ
jgi:hypothetical protein